MSDGNLLFAYAQRSILGFAKLAQSVLWPEVPLETSWNIRAVHYQLKQMEAGGFNRLLLNLPFGYHHTTLIGLARVAWMIGHKPTLRFLIILPEEWSKNEVIEKYPALLHRLLTSPEYGRLFPKAQMVLRNDFEFANQSGGKIYLCKARTELPGYRLDHIVVLDAESYADFEKTNQHSPTAEWCITQAFLKIKNDPQTSIIVLNGRRGERDLNTRLIEGEFGDWRYMEIKVLSLFDQRYQLSDKGGGEYYLCKEGDILDRDPEADEKGEGLDLDNYAFQVIYFSDEFAEVRRSSRK